MNSPVLDQNHDETRSQLERKRKSHFVAIKDSAREGSAGCWMTGLRADQGLRLSPFWLPLVGQHVPYTLCTNLFYRHRI